MKRIVAEEKAHELDADGFLQLVREHSDFSTLTQDTLSLFVDKIVVHHRDVIHGETVQKVEIYYRLIGNIELPRIAAEEREQYIRYFGRHVNEKAA
ncbi:MAG: DUF4368 domain-containing protein [Clostridia bacterium]|nr:DUF4368 domain-containing protein [Clostridia bacterium]